MAVLILFFTAMATVLLVASISPERRKKLDLISRDLRALEKKAPDDQKYAIKENIAFFQAIKTVPGYIFWSLTRRRNIDPVELLEIADLPLPVWERELYTDLAHVERKDFPGLSKPLRNLLVKFLSDRKVTKVLDLGCGGMEVQRQVLVELKKQNKNCTPVFIGIDLAPQAWEAINNTFRSMKDDVDIRKINDISETKNYKPSKATVLFHCGDALEIASLHGKQFDVIISSRFRHHLDKKQKDILDHISLNIANYAIEYDDYRSAISWVAPISTAWYRPVLLNGAIFSQIRQPWKKELKSQNKMGVSQVQFFSPPGSYAKISKAKRISTNKKLGE